MICNADITNHAQIQQLLNALRADTQPYWGKMTPQQMVEHLVDAVRYTNGVLKPDCDFPPDVALQRKQNAKASTAPFPKNIFLGQLPENYEFTDLQAAAAQLIIELERFDKHFQIPGIEEIHGGFGPMNHEEWIWWHSKHFTHHFQQFGLIGE